MTRNFQILDRRHGHSGKGLSKYITCSPNWPRVLPIRLTVFRNLARLSDCIVKFAGPQRHESESTDHLHTPRLLELSTVSVFVTFRAHIPYPNNQLSLLCGYTAIEEGLILNVSADGYNITRVCPKKISNATTLTTHLILILIPSHAPPLGRNTSLIPSIHQYHNPPPHHATSRQGTSVRLGGHGLRSRRVSISERMKSMRWIAVALGFMRSI